MDFDPKTHFPRKSGFGDTALSVPDLQAEIARLTRENATIASDVAALLKDNTALEDKVEALTRENENLRQIERNVQAAREHEHQRAESALAEIARLREQMKDHEYD